MHIKSYAHILYHQAYTRFLILIATLFILLPTPIHAKVGGLAFLNPANSIEKRTSYSVFGDKEEQFIERLDISFDMRLPYREEVGYIVRVIDKTENKIFNVFYDGRGNDYFELNREGYKGLIKIRFNRQKLMLKQWFNVHISFNMKQQTISMSIDGEQKSVFDNHMDVIIAYPSGVRDNIKSYSPIFALDGQQGVDSTDPITGGLDESSFIYK